MSKHVNRFRRKSTEVEAFKWTGGPDQTEDPEWIVEAIKKGDVYFIRPGTKKVKMMIKHSSGLLTVRPGDYVIKGEKEGDIYPCSSDVFETIYEAVAPLEGY